MVYEYCVKQSIDTCPGAGGYDDAVPYTGLSWFGGFDPDGPSVNTPEDVIIEEIRNALIGST